jgi:putative FmdB family regulatory protein
MRSKPVEAENVETQVRKALTEIIDPETGLNIMRMDLIHDIEVTANGVVSLVFRPSSPVCPMAYSLANSIKKRLETVTQVNTVNVRVENFKGLPISKASCNHPQEGPRKGRLMPIYEYRCSECGQVSELLVNIGRNSDELICASCGGSRLEQLMSAPVVSVNNEPSGHAAGSTCCGSTPSNKGCVPGSCCGAS